MAHRQAKSLGNVGDTLVSMRGTYETTTVGQVSPLSIARAPLAHPRDDAEGHLSAPLSLTRASLGAPSDRFRWGEAKGRAEGSGQVRRIGEARVHGGCPHQFTGSYLARGMLER